MTYALLIKFILTGGLAVNANTSFYQTEEDCFATAITIYDKYRKVEGVDKVELQCLPLIPSVTTNEKEMI